MVALLYHCESQIRDAKNIFGAIADGETTTMVVDVIQALNELGKAMFLSATLYLPLLRFSTESMR